MTQQQTNYQLLKDVHEAVNRIEDKLTKDIKKNSERIDVIEEKTDTWIGKATIGLIVLSTMIGTGITFIVDWLRGIKS